MVKLGLSSKLGLGGVAVIGIVAFIFRDKISEFLSGISGGAQTVSNLGQTGNILSENLLGNLTGLQDVLKGITEFKLPSFELPKFDFNFDWHSNCGCNS